MHPVDFFFEIWLQVPEVARGPLQTILTHPFPPRTIGSVCETLRAAGRALGDEALEAAADAIHKIACDRGLPWGFTLPNLEITELLCEGPSGIPVWLVGLQAQTQRLHSWQEALRTAERAYTEEITDLRETYQERVRALQWEATLRERRIFDLRKEFETEREALRAENQALRDRTYHFTVEVY